MVPRAAPLLSLPILKAICRVGPPATARCVWKRPRDLRWQSVLMSANRLLSRVRAPKAATLFGSGQLEEIAELIEQLGAELLIVDGGLTAIQQRNLEDKVGVKVIDRTGLILEIFGERAATAEGRFTGAS